MALQWLLLTGGPDLLTGPLSRPGGASRDSGVRLFRTGSASLIGPQLMQVLVALLGD